MQNISADMKSFIYSNNIMSRLNGLIRRLLSGLTDSELENLVRVREEAHPISVRRTPIPKSRRNVQHIKSGCQRKPGKMLKMSTEGGQQNKFILTS